ncbi:hypothetical protein McanMca71_007540 [Microsporum canis]
MPHYVRFLKLPKIERASSGLGSIKTLVTLTTDLGDSFLAEEVELTASVHVDNYDDSFKCIKQKKFSWPAGAREVSVSIDGIRLDLRQHAIQLRIGPADHHVGPDDDFAVLSAIPQLISAWSPSFGGSGPLQADKLVLRRLKARCPAEVRIWEETGNNLARHIWYVGYNAGYTKMMTMMITGDSSYQDASLAWLMLFQEALTPVEDDLAMCPFFTFKNLLRRKNGKSHFNVIELGAGCGIVGIALAQFLTECSVLLTDLEEVREIVSRNISMSKPAAGSTLDFQVLDWNDSIPGSISGRQYDIVVVSDCTYNSDSLPALVDTMAALVDWSPQAIIIVALKRRHESEAVFFELMRCASLDLCDKARIRLPSVYSDGETERVDIEIYCFRLSSTSLRNVR